MPETKPQYGLPYQQFPAAQQNITSESMLNEQIRVGRQQIYDRFSLQWQEINRSRKFIGGFKADTLQRELHAKSRQEMLQFNQQAQQQLMQLQNINKLAEVSGMTSDQAKKIKARMTFGRDAAEAMYPEERSIPQQFGELDIYSHRISQELEMFRTVDKRIPALLRKKPGRRFMPFLQEEFLKKEIQIWDSNTPGKLNKETDKLEYWRKAEPEEIGIYQMYLQEEKDIAKHKRELLGMPDISRRIVQPDTKGGTFSDKIAESIPKPAAKQRQKVIRQRNKRTGQERISYDGGETWQIVTG